ncbi:Mov34/MPN/PAD-1 family protein [Yersinia kristensenii]|uniref:Mov34/MPN/PAD-1 family protein n=1 Tax=Yersinia kristensenii TaxID=28152 RepID=UPI0005E00184|nr:M67 family metallopeptidase [Yersinia kristensenii]MDA5472992.1 M67 family metallopeptidase [Yersinia kristensenii]MDA5477998.1 M67 family metallopeptidase [Yersinia kristensenii]MDA5505922.1 M67 family metallopeptidase [Yersinia kristensenii]NIK96306.1 M67 family metallopeptidase [Yersinia kristensenii]NIL08548.1 M67 family metallopeptidase [Yersinia kristensenii]
MIRLAVGTENQIRIEGENSYPNECCGALLGLFDKEGNALVEAILPIINAREDEEQYHRFVITADDYLRAERTARVKGIEVVGFYHSHPDHPAIPSEYDREHALPFYAYIIVAVAQGGAGDLTSWRLDPNSRQFEQESVITN